MNTDKQLTIAEGLILGGLRAIVSGDMATWDDDRRDRLVKAMREAGHPGMGMAAAAFLAEHLTALYESRRSALLAARDALLTGPSEAG